MVEEGNVISADSKACSTRETAIEEDRNSFDPIVLQTDGRIVEANEEPAEYRLEGRAAMEN